MGIRQDINWKLGLTYSDTQRRATFGIRMLSPADSGISIDIVEKGTASPVEYPGIILSFLEMQGLCPISYVGKTGDLK